MTGGNYILPLDVREREKGNREVSRVTFTHSTPTSASLDPDHDDVSKPDEGEDVKKGQVLNKRGQLLSVVSLAPASARTNVSPSAR